MSTISCQNDLSSRVNLQTFVFFDLETTGFIQGSNPPKITEISLVATSRDSLLSEDGSLPRVMHKLTIPLQPMKFIPLKVSQITGLYNDLLQYEKPFDEEMYVLMNSFIGRLCPPICFVAHNGNQFDYPILLATLNDMGKTLSKDILCIDSLIAFKTLLSDNNLHNDAESISFMTREEDLNLLEDGCDEEFAKIVDLMTSPTTPVKVDAADIPEECGIDLQTMQKVNETTPTHQIRNIMNIIPHKVFVNSGGSLVKKRLPFTQGKPDNFKLETIYKHLVGVAPFNSHSAEDDCLSLLICVMKIGDSFIRWADLNASPLMQYTINQK